MKSHGIVDFLATLFGVDDARVPKDGEVAGSDGEINRATGRHLRYAARPSTRGEPGQQGDTIGIAQRLEEPRREDAREVATGLTGLGAFFAHLRHYASLEHGLGNVNQTMRGGSLQGSNQKKPPAGLPAALVFDHLTVGQVS